MRGIVREKIIKFTLKKLEKIEIMNDLRTKSKF